MTYTQEIKRELLAKKSQDRPCCDLASLTTFYALLCENAQADGIKLKTETPAVGRKIILLTKKYLKVQPEVKISNRLITVNISNHADIETLKNNLRLKSQKADFFYSKIDPLLTINDCCKKACLGAAFLANGHITDPKKSYHFEISTHKKRVFSDILEIFTELDLNGKTTLRKNKYVLYLKNNEDITDFLSVIGAKQSLFKFVDVKMEKEIKNEINRQLNCESANENKTIEAGLVQIRAINKLIKGGKLETLKPALLEAANLRLHHPDLPLSELVLKSETKLTKSGLNHRLNKIISIADNL